jgi:hypothetical protein
MHSWILSQLSRILAIGIFKDRTLDAQKLLAAFIAVAAFIEVLQSTEQKKSKSLSQTLWHLKKRSS